GTGLLTARLARSSRASSIVGLDVSDAMIAQARRLGRMCETVEFVVGDFRGFRLSHRFDAVVCASNSLNYVGCASELVQVFDAVGGHLAPGGVFLFDTYTRKGMRRLSGHYWHSRDRRFAIHFRFDADHGADESRVLLPSGVELHRRVPIDAADVVAAA